MLSLYIHIPFCRYKCTYCSFFVLPEEHANKDLNYLKDDYLTQLLNEVHQNRERYPNEQLRTVYIGGGTPLQLGKERLWQLLDTIRATRGNTDLEELTIELNPDPQDEVLAFVQETQERYKDLPRMRRSFGIQTFDDSILEKTKRAYTFGALTMFLRSLPELKQQNTIYNLDFIAFGKGEQGKSSEYLPWTKTARDFFERLVGSYAFDGFSVYTLELFPGSDRYYQNRHLEAEQRVRGDDDNILQEAAWIREVIGKAGYQRYEVSNFALSGKRSLHNMVYRTGGSYLGLGMYASSYVAREHVEQEGCADVTGETASKSATTATTTASAACGRRRKHTEHRKDYLAGKYVDEASVHELDEKESRIERVILGLRTDRGLPNYDSYADLFVPAWRDLLQRYEQEGLVITDGDRLVLTPAGRDVYNTLITDFMVEV